MGYDDEFDDDDRRQRGNAAEDGWPGDESARFPRRGALGPCKRTLTEQLGRPAPAGRRARIPGKISRSSRLPMKPSRKQPSRELPHRAEMERLFSASLGDVEARTGQTETLAPLGARAAAKGNKVWFAPSNPDPALVAHEVTHVVQQRKAGASSVAADQGVSRVHDPAEREAEAVARRVTRFGTGGPAVQVEAAPTAALALDTDKGAAAGKSVDSLYGWQPVQAAPAGDRLAAMKLTTLPPTLPNMPEMREPLRVTMALYATDEQFTAYLYDATTGEGFVRSIPMGYVTSRLAALAPKAARKTLSKLSGVRARFVVEGDRVRVSVGMSLLGIFMVRDLAVAAATHSFAGLRPVEGHVAAGRLAAATLYRGQAITKQKALAGLGFKLGPAHKIERAGLHAQLFGNQSAAATQPVWMNVFVGRGRLSIALTDDLAGDTGVVATMDLIALGQKLASMLKALGKAGARAAEIVVKVMASIAKAGMSAVTKVASWLGGILRFGFGPGVEIGWSLAKAISALISGGWNLAALIPDILRFSGDFVGGFALPDMSWVKGPLLGGFELTGDLLAALLRLLKRDSSKKKGGGLDKVLAAVRAVGRGVVAIVVPVAKLLGKAGEGVVGMTIDVVKLLAKLGGRAAMVLAKMIGRAGSGLKRFVHPGRDLVLRIYDEKNPERVRVGFDMRQLFNGVQAGDLVPVELRLGTGIATLEAQGRDTKGLKSSDRLRVVRPGGKAGATMQFAPEPWLAEALHVKTNAMLSAYISPRQVQVFVEPAGKAAQTDKDKSGVLLTIASARLARALGRLAGLNTAARKRFRLRSVGGGRIRIDWLGGSGENYAVYSLAGFVRSPRIEPAQLVPLEMQIAAAGVSLRGGAAIGFGKPAADGVEASTLVGYKLGGRIELPDWAARMAGKPVGYVYYRSYAAGVPRSIFLSVDRIDQAIKRADAATGGGTIASAPLMVAGVELTLTVERSMKIMALVESQLQRAGAVAGTLKRTAKKLLGDDVTQQLAGVRARVVAHGLRFDGAGGDYVEFAWSAIMGVASGRLAVRDLKPTAFKLSSQNTSIELGPLDATADAMPATLKEIAADNYTVQVSELPSPLRRTITAFGYTDKHFVRLNPEESRMTGDGSLRAHVVADVFELRGGRARGVRIAFEMEIEPVLRALLPDRVVDRVLKGGTNGANGVHAGVNGLVIMLARRFGHGKKAKELGLRMQWNLATLMRIMMEPDEVVDQPSMLLPDAIGGFVSGKRFRIAFAGNTRAELAAGQRPEGTRVDAALLGAVEALGAVVPPKLAARAELYIDVPGLELAKSALASLASGEMAELARVELVLRAEDPEAPSSVYSLTLFLDLDLTKKLASFIPVLGFAVKMYGVGSDFMEDPEGNLEGLMYTPEALYHLLKGSAGEAWGDSLSAMDPEEAALLAAMSEPTMRESVKAARAYENLRGTMGPPTKEQMMASSLISPEDKEKLSEIYASLSEEKVKALTALVRTAEKYNIDLGGGPVDAEALTFSLDNYKEQVALMKAANAAGVALMRAKEAGASQGELDALAATQRSQMEAASSKRVAARDAAGSPLHPSADAVAGVAGAPSSSPAVLDERAPVSAAARAVQDAIFAASANGTVSDSDAERLMAAYGGLSQGELAQLLREGAVESMGNRIELVESERWFVEELLLQLMNPEREAAESDDDGADQADRSAAVQAEYRRRAVGRVAATTGLKRASVRRAIRHNRRDAAAGRFDAEDYSSLSPESPDFVAEVAAYQRQIGARVTGMVDRRTRKKHGERAARGASGRDELVATEAAETKAATSARRRVFDPYKQAVILYDPARTTAGLHVDASGASLGDDAEVGIPTDAGGSRAVTLRELRGTLSLPGGYQCTLQRVGVVANAVPNRPGTWRVDLAFRLRLRDASGATDSKTERRSLVYTAGAAGHGATASPVRRLDLSGIRKALDFGDDGTAVFARQVTAQLGGATVRVTEAFPAADFATSRLVRFSFEVRSGNALIYDDATGMEIALRKGTPPDVTLRLSAN